MYDILFVRTFCIVSAMLILTAITAKTNRSFETSVEFWGTILGMFGLLFVVHYYKDSYPINLFCVGGFSLVVGWAVGPTIEYFGEHYKMRRHFKDKGTPLKRGETPSPAHLQEFSTVHRRDLYHKEWQNTIFLAVMGTALGVLSTAGLVFSTNINFEPLGGVLLICLLILIIMGLINSLFLKSKMFSLIKAYMGAVVFTLYLLFDFHRLKQNAGDESWATAISISVNIYLDIINLFMDLLEILAEAN